MGGFVADKQVPSIIVQLDMRFQGEALTEMVGLQKEFKIFSGRHTLASAAALLDLAPGGKDRRGWFLFLNGLKKVPSDVARLNGHDRIISALKKNLEAKSPMQVHFTSHPASATPGVTVTLERPFSYSRTEFLTISAPTGRASGGKSKSA
ncbi:MAG: hypothetical protein BGP05_15955 [Rhizobiales bacterium 62-47]|nr:hypothetical protein [Hyphomicrobiales bacterium]OJY13454.1 MAG: hypothetical protein BGP05_15955 [Rhizobiales bacterium 62-47]